ncbi:MAG: hydroxyacid dehydrogenase [Alphaproteobacteria bacterium]|nr:hydroxyacid dehydrogenase [Alphaproteobacteria bacterium]
MNCLIIQPIHPIGEEILEAAGIAVLKRTERKPTVDEVAAAVAEVDTVITRDAPFQRPVFERAKNLKAIAIHGIGANPIDLHAATDHGVMICRTPDANIQSVAEHAIGLMLAVGHRLPDVHQAVRNRDFSPRYEPDFQEFHRKTLLIVGWGRIGALTAKLARAFLSMNIIVYSPRASAEDVAAGFGRKIDDLKTAMSEADVVSVHTPARPDTVNLIGAAEIAAMKPTGILINTGRGAVVDETALAQALNEGRIWGAGLDVFSNEPLAEGHPVLTARNTVLTPHIGGQTEECLIRVATEAAEHIITVSRGGVPATLINTDVLDRVEGRRQ